MTQGEALRRVRAHPLGRYGVALALTALATAVKLAFPNVIGHGAPVAIYLGVVMLASWFGGVGPGLLVTALLTVAGAYYFSAPYDSFDVDAPHDVVRIALAAAEGATIALLAGALHRARAAEVARAEQLARTTEQLLHSQRVQAIGALAGGVAHDFNNLLSIILSYTSLLLGRLPQGDANRDLVTELEGAAERAAELTRRLLAYARKTPIAPRVLDLNACVRGLERMLRTSLGPAIELELALNGAPVRVLADPAQMEQLLMNLALNARDAMPSGGRLTIGTSHATLGRREAEAHGLDGGGFVALTVKDTGIGIPADRVARVFEPFYTTKEDGKGSGLGLAIVHGVVERAGGRVWVESAAGRGTEFHVLLPESAAEG